MSAPLPAYAGEKSRRLYWAFQKGGIVKITDQLVWIFEREPPTLTDDGIVLSARDFVSQVADALGIHNKDVFSLEDDQIRKIARKLTGIASLDAREARDDQKHKSA